MSLDRALGLSPCISCTVSSWSPHGPWECRNRIMPYGLYDRILPALRSGIGLCGPRRDAAENKEGHCEKVGFSCSGVVGVIGGFLQWRLGAGRGRRQVKHSMMLIFKTLLCFHLFASWLKKMHMDTQKKLESIKQFWNKFGGHSILDFKTYCKNT